ncbi:MAG: hypothetical protein PHH63_03900 [Bacteroidales bacterium]|nr:hypothetical protein [Bacteroidales bacterium]
MKTSGRLLRFTTVERKKYTNILGKTSGHLWEDIRTFSQRNLIAILKILSFSGRYPRIVNITVQSTYRSQSHQSFTSSRTGLLPLFEFLYSSNWFGAAKVCPTPGNTH